LLALVRAARLCAGKSLWCRHCFASQIVPAEAETAITRLRPRKTSGPRSRILPLRAFSFFRQTEGSKARGLDADGKLLSLVFLHRQRRISRALLLCSRSGSLLGILQSCYHRNLLNAADPLRVRHLAKKNPAAMGPDTGLRTTSFASTSVVKAQWPSSLPLTRRAATAGLAHLRTPTRYKSSQA
jgi:hypothetical protein